MYKIFYFELQEGISFQKKELIAKNKFTLEAILASLATQGGRIRDVTVELV